MWKIIVPYLFAVCKAFIAWAQKNPSVVIALCALGVSVYSIYLTRQAFIATHRPYVYAINRKDNKGTLDLNTVLLPCFNAPAKITNREFYYVAVKTKENGKESYETKFEKKFPNEILLYPTEIPTSQISIARYDFKKEILEKDPKVKLRRKVRIDYKEFSSDRTYYFEGNWDYNSVYDLWEDKDKFGN